MPDTAIKTDAKVRAYDAIIVGAGFAGMYMVHRLRQSGLSVRLLEAGTGPGGVWYWNRYPGARCDVESIEYQYGFDNDIQLSWTWSERYATQPEILKYANYIAERFQINKDADYNTRIASAVWNEKTRKWVLTTTDGIIYETPYCIMATGHLSATNTPKFEGLESFKGKTYHTGEWPHGGVDFTGRTVGIIGTGSSGIQSIPIIAKQAKHLYVFQRTAAYSLPADNPPLTPDEVAEAKREYPHLREKVRYSHALSFLEPGEKSAWEYTPAEQRERLEARWRSGGFPFLQTFTDVMTDMKVNRMVADFICDKIREKVKDPKVAALLTTMDYPIGSKRPCLDTGYFETYNRPNVTLVDIRTKPIERLTSKGLVTDGKEYEVDDIVFATGFDAMTGALSRIDIRGEGGRSLKDKWASGPMTYLGYCTAGFPNLFMLNGPGSPSVLANCITGVEYQVEWVGDCIDYLRAKGAKSIQPKTDAEVKWGMEVDEIARPTLYHHANSWYLGANIPGKPRVFMVYLGFGRYRKVCEAVAAEGYPGFAVA